MERKARIFLTLWLVALNGLNCETILATLTPDLPGDTYKVRYMSYG